MRLECVNGTQTCVSTTELSVGSGLLSFKFFYTRENIYLFILTANQKHKYQKTEIYLFGSGDAIFPLSIHI